MKSRAIVIGNNYFGSQYQLNGCITDARSLRNFLYQKGLVSLSNCRLVVEASRKTTLDALRSLVLQSKVSNLDFVFFSYSGHGSYVRDTSGDETDGRDECICPVDFISAGMIMDDEMRSIIQDFNPNTRVVIMFDSCHSGSALDLPYDVYGVKVNNDVFSNHPNIIFISGCMDEQTSADAYINNVYCGAMTTSFLEVIKKDITLTKDARRLIEQMNQYLIINGYTQRPLCTLSFQAQGIVPLF
jgi:hypothetical protein